MKYRIIVIAIDDEDDDKRIHEFHDMSDSVCCFNDALAMLNYMVTKHRSINGLRITHASLNIVENDDFNHSLILNEKS